MENPWSNISWTNTIADCDRDYPVLGGKFKFGSDDYVNYINRNDAAKKQQGKKPIELSFRDCLPEPFYGDKESNVYLLNMNPGEPDYAFCQQHDQQSLYENFCKSMLNHQPHNPGFLFDKENKTIVYDPAKYNEVMDGIFSNHQNKLFKIDKDKFPLRPHAGDVWQREAWRILRDKLGRDPRLFIIEFFPYHSTSGFSFPKELPSYVYRNYLIDQAMKAGKLIVIMRKEHEWYKIQDTQLGNVGERLENYSNKVLLINTRRPWLSPGNFIIPAQLDVLNMF